ncbi:hypothetical protein [Arthrospiribacter ruber]|uniref:hypothetical protein n=1 Tax=Arthrospiribacter ruber TaxID=2487934 RepID=UPI001C5BC84E|nr:hypothetical protein [Arthrospiribacter ruber]
MKKQFNLYQKKGTASLHIGLGDFSDLSNECKRLLSSIFGYRNFLQTLKCLLFLFTFGYQYLTRGLTAFDIIFERKPKNPI